MVYLNIGRNPYFDSLLWLFFIVLTTEGQQFNMTGSSEFASLRQAYTWTCSMFVPPGQTIKGVKFNRNNVLLAVIGYFNNDCANQSANPRYTYRCLSDYVYTLTIPAENMTEYEQGSLWRCEYMFDSSYRSSDVIIKIARPPKVHMLSQQDILEGRNLSVTCKATPGNPSLTTFYWTKVEFQGFRQNGATLHIPNIQRNSSGTYRCTAENSYSNGEKGTHNQSMVVNVLYPPVVNTLFQQDIIEGRDLSVNCTATPGNPSSTAFYWTKVDNSGFRQNGPTLQLLNIQRNSSRTYICIAENMYSNGNKGTDNQSMVVNVIYQPAIENRQLQIVNESETVILTRNISGNPVSNVSWFNKTELLKTETSVTTTSFFIERATCSDTQNFTLVASNGVGSNATAVVELIVNCKPIPDKTNITLGVTFTTGIEFSIKIIAYPVPQYELVYENGTRNNQMLNNITRNAVNNFTVYYRQVVVDQSSFGLYYLTMRNLFGESTVTVNVIEQRTGRPETPRSIAVVCEITQARIQWISSFNGGDQQYFTVVILNFQDGTNISYRFHDKGENELHAAHISNLQPLVTYWFVVSAKNSYGSSPSEITRCKTVQEKASSKTGMVVGSVGGALVLITIVLILGIVHRRFTCICKIALENKDRNTTVAANKDKSNYSTIQEQQEHSERNMYDALTSTENANQYEDILKKDNNGYDEKLYEKLQSSADKDNEASSSKRRIPLKIKDLKDDKFVTQNTEEYANTSFME
ncbi:neural cell adhesion molecule 1 isoform X2 [Magallana gigas]|uniref:neural cell adhesion molecule 1 isoform X2 n=1 Tax=Magallana gigas TaxID=29159 RepID=UPI003341322D